MPSCVARIFESSKQPLVDLSLAVLFQEVLSKFGRFDVTGSDERAILRGNKF